MQCSKFHRILVTVVSCLIKSLKKAPKITSSIGIGNHFTTCARIFDTDVVTGDEDASLDCLIARVSESTTALVSIFLVGRTTDVAHQRICLKKSKTLMCLADLLNTWFTLCYWQFGNAADAHFLPLSLIFIGSSVCKLILYNSSEDWFIINEKKISIWQPTP